MKAIKNKRNAVKALLLLLLIGFQSCGTYNSKTSDIESDLFNGNFNKAIAGIEKNKFLKKKRNKLLYLMEKGKVEHMQGNYEASNALLEQAYILIDDRIKTNAGQAVASKLTNPMAMPYKGEDFEKVTIHYYKALNYFMMGMPNEALVEAKRINIKLYQLNENYKENKNKYSEDAFSQILQGIIYESVGDINNAFIAYRNAEEIYTKNGGDFFDVPMPEQLKKDLLRTSKLMGFTQEYNDYRTKFNIPAEDTPKKTTPEDYQTKPTGEAVIFWENGIGPAKDQIVITASGAGGIFYGSYMDGDILEEIIIPIPIGSNIGSINAIAIPRYRERGGYYNKAEIIVNGKPKEFNLAQDFYPIAKQSLKDRMLRETIDIVTRFAAKKATSAGLGALGKELLGDAGGDLVKLGADIAGAATEKADTRNWQTLPATISYIRVPLHEGENKFIIRKYGAMGTDTDTITIPYKRGLQIVNYFDVGRTQIIPAAESKPALKALSDTSATSKQKNSFEQSKGTTTFTNASLQVQPVMDNKIQAKYNTWIKAGNDVEYRATYEEEMMNGKKFFIKKFFFKSEKNSVSNITFTITETPFDSDSFAEVSISDYYNENINQDGKKKYFKITSDVQDGMTTNATTVYQTSPDFYVTILNVQ
ncbi:hypothetical protein E0W68_08830 [Flavobacterium salilacus subsp. salilacus]|uniref:COG3014 family protein n=1 Tax=Flavobacterium TaxID=237 RepID=UPI001075700E|nr:MULTISPECIES: hypothetical protein [Flavobacterium]KAF2518422.1 hypothetical protein E0W68_08830 [Flavobacterium salilacus subsp. salilacus]MBE1615058.1 hypothetical protein [Flavobacterium sp. SaA2.13]